MKYRIEHIQMTKTLYEVEANSEEEAERKFKEQFFENEIHGKGSHTYSCIWDCREVKQEDEKHGKGN